jgi:hypothetical protein
VQTSVGSTALPNDENLEEKRFGSFSTKRKP